MNKNRTGKVMPACVLALLVAMLLPVAALAALPADIYDEGLYASATHLSDYEMPSWRDTGGKIRGLDLLQVNMGAGGAGCGEVVTPDGTTSTDQNQDPATNNGDYTLTISYNGNGKTTPAAGKHTYAAGTSVTITATPAAGTVFTGWSGALSGKTNPISIAMDSDRNLIANFAAVSSNSGGSSDLPDRCTGMCNSATPVFPTVYEGGGKGNVTMYTTEASNGGACNYGVTNVMSFAAMSVNVVPGDAKGQWQGGSICGQCAEVTAITSQGPKKVVVRIMDKCPDGDCGIDLGGSAPAEIMSDGFGRYDGQWRFVSCEGHPGVSDGPPSLDVFNGSNAWWSRVHVRNGATAVDSIEWRSANGTSGIFPFAANPENAYEVPQSEVLQSGAASILITVRYVDGSTATVTLSPQQLSVPGASYLLN